MLLLFLAPQLGAQQVDIEALINHGQNAQARAELAKYPQPTPIDSARVLYWRGRLALNEGASSSGMDLLERSVALDPGVGASHFWLAIAYIRATVGKGRLRQAWYAQRVRSHLERATAISPTMVDARLYLIQYYLRAPGFMGGGDAKARAQADTIFRINPQTGYLARAQVAEATKDLVGAERAFAGALRDFPNDASSYDALGGFYRRSKNYPKAVEVFERLKKLAPDDAHAQLQMGRTIAEWGQQLERGEKELVAAISHPDLATLEAASAHYYLGMIRQKRGDRAGAREQFSRALALNPALEDALAALRTLQ
jgi:tetratricopeptide (TPR) repeat protein